MEARAELLHNQPDTLPQSREEALLIRFWPPSGKHGVSRHVGSLSELYTPAGLVWGAGRQGSFTGQTVIGTGECWSREPILWPYWKGRTPKRCPFGVEAPSPNYYLDGDYIMAAAGLLS